MNRFEAAGLQPQSFQNLGRQRYLIAFAQANIFSDHCVYQPLESARRSGLATDPTSGIEVFDSSFRFSENTIFRR